MSFLSNDDSLHGKSWVEICDEERTQDEDLIIMENESKTDIKNDSPTKIRSEKCENQWQNQTINQSLEEGEIRDDSMVENNLKTPQRTNSIEQKTPNSILKSLSYANVVQGMKSTDTTPSKAVTVTDDLSLTSHLDIFHVASPVKDISKTPTANIAIDEDTVMYSPCKKEDIMVKNMKRPFQLIESPVQRPRPRSASDSSVHKKAKSKANSDVHSRTIEEVEENIASGSEDGRDRSVASPNLKRELEVNPEILSRRQKQIDYGKNTLGYDRYIKVIPKHKRRKEHPKTPPKHLKMSRRTWDGLIKNWRLKLHRWDPVSENDEVDFENTNFDQYSLSSDEPSSYDSSSVRSDSAPSTPKQRTNDEGADQWFESKNKSECSKELWSDCKQKKKTNNDEFLGCELLSENCVKAYS